MNDLVFVFSAFALGALHALEPGHGKTVVAAYLVGSKGRVRDAITLGGVVTFTHTFSIILLGILTSVAAAYFVPETVHEVMEIASGLLILGVGVWMLQQRFGRRASVEPHAHPHGQHHAHSDNSHEHSDARALPASFASTAVIWQRGSEADHPAESPVVAHADAHNALVFSSARHAHGEVWHAHEVDASARHHHHGLDADTSGHHHPADDAGHQHDVPSHAERDHPHPHPHADDRHHAHPRPDRQLHHEHGSAGHSHGARAHTHGPASDQRLGLRGLIALGVSGGIVPCPAALALLLAATAAGSVITGVGLVVVFSLGLAFVLIAIGLAMVKAAGVAGRRLSGDLTDRLSRHASAVSAVVVTLLGIAATARAVLHVAGVLAT